MNLSSVVKVETMTSSQLAELLGKEKKHVNESVKKMFSEKIVSRVIRPTLRANGQVLEYHLPELESKMFVAKHDIEYLEKITKFWIDNKNGTHVLPSSSISFKEKAEVAMMAADWLKVADSSKITMLSTVCEENGVSTKFLPVYTEEGATKSLTQLLKEHGCKLSAKAVNIRLLGLGILCVKTRPSTNNGGKDKEYKSLTEKGLTWGKNLINVKAERGTQPHYYVENFPKLIELVEQY